MPRQTNKTTGRPPRLAGARRKKAKKTGKLKSWFIPAVLTAIILASLAATAYLVFLRQNIPAPAVSVPRGPTTVVGPDKKKIPVSKERQPLHEELSAELTKTYQPENNAPPSLTDTDGKPRVAIIIDDLGYRQDIVADLLALNLNITFSFLPFAPHTTKQAALASLQQREVLLHLPMQPTDPKWDPGPGTLTVDMNREEIRSTVVKDLAAVPKAIGINNHMGSRFTENRQAMGNLLEIIRAHDLFFVDSVTSPKSIGASLAVAMGVKTARRHIFLDNEPVQENIIAQLDSLVRMAEKHGWAVGIGHPHPATLEALREFNRLFGRRVDTVGISRLVY